MKIFNILERLVSMKHVEGMNGNYGGVQVGFRSK